MLNPIFESGARRRMRTVKTPIILTACLAALLVFSLALLRDFMGQGLTVDRVRRSTEWFVWATALEFALIVLVAPALGAGSVAGERERQTLDPLVTTGVGARRIVTGKLMEQYAFLLLILLCGAPIMTLSCVTGGMPAGDVLAVMLALAVMALAALSVGMLMSVICRRSLTAVIGAYLMIFAIGAGTWALAKHGPLAARYTHETLKSLAFLPTRDVLATLPPLIYLNPAVALVMLLASRTGILHRTMEETMRLRDIYTASRAAGFGAVACVSVAAILLASLLLVALSCLILRAQTDGLGAGRICGKGKARGK